MNKCTQSGCQKQATHVLATKLGELAPFHPTFCREHAFLEGREKCGCCESFQDTVEVDGVEFLHTYRSGTLDWSGCCPDHP